MSRERLNIIGRAAFEDSMYVKSNSILIHELMLGRHDDCLLTQGVKVAENGLKKDGRSRDHPTRSNYNKTYAEDSMDVKIVVTGVGGKDGEGRTRNKERDHQKGGSFEKGGKRHKRAHTPHPRPASKPLHFSFSEAKCSPPKIKPPSTKPHPSHALTKHIEISSSALNDLQGEGQVEDQPEGVDYDESDDDECEYEYSLEPWENTREDVTTKKIFDDFFRFFF